jgi:hypothetical protein
MRKFFTVCACLLAFSLTAISQDEPEASVLTETTKSEKAEKVDEFGSLGECEFSARLDNWLILLHNNESATGFVIFYQGKNVLPAEYEKNFPVAERRARNYIAFRNVDSIRLTFVNGGFREQASTELWIVPNGAEPPEPTDTVPRPKIPSNKTFLYDRNFISGTELDDSSQEFILPSVLAQQEAEQKAYEEASRAENAVEETPVEEATAENAVDLAQPVEEETEIEKPTPEELEEAKFHWTSEKFGKLIKNRKDARGVIIFYADDAYYDVGKLQSHIEDGKRRIAAAAQISPDKIQVIFGGYRNSIEAEFWIVPKKGEMPKPKPEEKPIEEKPVEEENIQ